MTAGLFVRRQRLHRLRVHRDLNLIPILRRRQRHADARKGIHERDVAPAPRAEIEERDTDLPDTEGERGDDAVAGRIDLDVPHQPHADEARQREQHHRRTVHLRRARQQPEERREEDEDHRGHRDPRPRRAETEVHEERFFAQIAVPDDEVLAEGQVTPERREREAELADVVEMDRLNQPVRAGESLVPRHRDQRKEHERAQPGAHEEPPAVQRALEMKREPHRQIPRQHRPAVRKQEHRENGELALKRMRRMDFASCAHGKTWPRPAKSVSSRNTNATGRNATYASMKRMTWRDQRAVVIRCTATNVTPALESAAKNSQLAWNARHARSGATRMPTMKTMSPMPANARTVALSQPGISALVAARASSGVHSRTG